MSKELVVVNNTFAILESKNSLPTVDLELQKELTEADKSGFETESGLIPIVSIRQKDLKNEKGKVLFPAGGFKMFDSVSHSTGQMIADVDGNAGLTLTFLLDQTGRVFFEKIGDEKPRCLSNNGKIGIGNPGGNCIKCQFAQWINGEPPICKQNMITLVYDYALKTCYTIRFVRSGLKPYGNFKESIRRAGFPIHAVVVKLTTEYQDDKGEYYTPKFDIINDLGGKNIDLFRTMKKFREELEPVFHKTVEVAVEEEKPEPTETTYQEDNDVPQI